MVAQFINHRDPGHPADNTLYICVCVCNVTQNIVDVINQFLCYSVWCTPNSCGSCIYAVSKVGRAAEVVVGGRADEQKEIKSNKLPIIGKYILISVTTDAKVLQNL